MTWIEFESAHELLMNLNFVFSVNEFEFKDYKKMNGSNPTRRRYDVFSCVSPCFEHRRLAARMELYHSLHASAYAARIMKI